MSGKKPPSTAPSKKRQVQKEALPDMNACVLAMRLHAINWMGTQLSGPSLSYDQRLTLETLGASTGD
jgi:hypothetical protein